MYARRFAWALQDRPVVGVAGLLADAHNGDLALEERVRALWSLAFQPALAGPRVATSIGGLLDHPSPLLAREAYEVLCTLHVDGALPELAIAAGSRGGRVVVSPRSFAALEPVSAEPPRAWCADLDLEVRPLVDVCELLERPSRDGPHAHGLTARAVATALLVLRGARLARLSAPGVVDAARFGLAHGAWSLEAPRQRTLAGHEVLDWGEGEAHVVVVPALSGARRVLVDTPPTARAPGGRLDPVAAGDAWFSPLPHARGHLAFHASRAWLVDVTGPPRVVALEAGEATTWGPYDVTFAPGGAMVRVASPVSDGPTRTSTAAAAAARRAKNAA